MGQTWHGNVGIMRGLVGCCHDEGPGCCLVSNTVMYVTLNLSHVDSSSSTAGSLR